MARKVRLFVEDVAVHILVSGINGEDIFRDDDDYRFYIQLLKDIKSAYISIHAYVLMPKNIQLLCTFSNKDALSRFMQSLGLKYVSYFNKKYSRSGTIWECRYKSSLVEDKYVLAVMQYIESSPLRSAIIETIKNYPYSSFLKNALDKKGIKHDE